MSFDRDSLRHAVATLAYRAAKAVRGAPASFAGFRAGPTTRTPLEIVAHMGDLFDWGKRMLEGQPQWTTASLGTWESECDRFFAALEAFDAHLASGAPIAYDTARIFQGPIADALTHTGQLTMLRRLHGAPMKGESYNRAEIVPGRVGAQQTPADPRYEFD
jgi:hypothetical protein